MPEISLPARVRVPPCFVMMGINEARSLGEGWFDLERDPRTGVAYRPTGREATLRMGVAPGTRKLGVLISARPSALGEPVTGHLEWGWGWIPSEREPSDRRSPLPASALPSPLGESAWVPCDRLDLRIEKDIWVVRELALSAVPPSGTSAPPTPPSPTVVSLRIRVNDPTNPPASTGNGGNGHALGFFVSALWGR